jgi:hypothetical protein
VVQKKGFLLQVEHTYIIVDEGVIYKFSFRNNLLLISFHPHKFASSDCSRKEGLSRSNNVAQIEEKSFGAHNSLCHEQTNGSI